MKLGICVSRATYNLLSVAGAARLPGFHCCVGSGGEKLLPESYKQKGNQRSLYIHSNLFPAHPRSPTGYDPTEFIGVTLVCQIK